MAMFSGRARSSRLLVNAAVVLAVVALVLSYAGRAVLRSQPFADRVTAALSDGAVQADVADHLADAVVRGNGDLVAIRPLIRSVAGGVVASPAFAAVFHRAVLEAHAAVVGEHRPAVLVNVADAAVLIQGVLTRLVPGAAAAVGAERTEGVFDVRLPGVVRDVVRAAQAVYRAAWVLALAAVLIAVAALWASRDRARTARHLGVSLMLGGLLVIAAYVVGGAVVQQTAPAGRGPAAGAVWGVLAGGLRTEALWLAGAGSVVAGAASMVVSTGDGESLIPRRLAERVGLRLDGGPARSLLAVALGIAVLLEPGPAVIVAAVGVGLLALAVGVAGTLQWATGSGGQVRRSASGARDAGGRRLAGAAVHAGGVLRRVSPVAVAVIALGGALAIIAFAGGDGAPAAPPLTCNGSAILCGRRLNDVAFAATHNSFASVTIPTFLFGQQDGTIADQLQYGIRGFLIDTYYGFPTRDRVRTDTTSLPKRTVAVAQLGEPAVQAAESIRARVGSQPTGPRSVYLCHGFCELGAVPLAFTLGELRAFLVANPGEVVIIINQDEGVTPADIAAAFHQAGLDDLLYRGALGPFPTLREMIDSGQRLVVMAENDAGQIPWYHLAYQHALQETPFRFTTTAALTNPAGLAGTCKPNRGPHSAPMFLLNNWVDTTPVPRPSNAARVNAYDTLLRRAQTCERIRHQLPNIIAVDFYRHGDVLGVVRALNRIAP